jgi:hypothetical protein
MRNLRFLVGCLIASCLASAVQEAPPKAAPPSTSEYSPYQEELIGEVTAGSKLGKELIAVSTVGSSRAQVVPQTWVAWTEERDGKKCVRLNGKQLGGSYDDVKYLAFSRDHAHLSFFAKRDSKWALMVDGVAHSPEYSTVSPVILQPHGTGESYTACKEKKCQLILDGKEVGPDYKEISYPVYSADGKRLAYMVKRGKKWIAVVDGKEQGPEFDDYWYSEWGFSPKGGHFFVAGRKGKEWFYAVDGNRGPGFDVISPISFSADEAHYAYGGTHAKGGFTKQKTFGAIVQDGAAVATYEGRGMSGSWTALGGSVQYIIAGVKQLQPDFHGVSTPRFDPNGELVYAARRQKGDVAVFVGDNAGPGFDEILSPIAFTKDGAHFAYVAKQGDDFVEVRDNQPGLVTSATNRGATGVRWISLSPNGGHLAYEIVAGGQRYKAGQTSRALRSVVIDGKKGPEYDAYAIVNFFFDPDSHHFFYIVLGAKGDRDLVSVDGIESRLYNDVTGAGFDDKGENVMFLARDGAKLFFVTYALPKRVAPLLAGLSTAAHPRAGSSEVLPPQGIITAAPSIESDFTAASAALASSRRKVVALGRSPISAAIRRKSRASACVILATLRICRSPQSRRS